MKRVFHSKYLIGVVKSGVEHVSAQRPGETSEDLLSFGKGSPEEALKRLKSSRDGLSSEEANKDLMKK